MKTMASSCLVVFCGLPAAGKSTFGTKLVDTLSNQNTTKQHNEIAGMEQVAYSDIELLNECHVIYICFDDFIPNNLYKDVDNSSRDSQGTNNEKTWKDYRNCIFHFVDELLTRLHNVPENDGNLEDDRLHMSEEWDYVCSKMAKKHFCKCWESITKDKSCGCDASHIIILDDNMFYSSMRYQYFQMARKYTTGFLQIYVSCDKDILLKQNSTRAAPVTTETISHMGTIFEIPDPHKNDWERNLIEFNSTQDDVKSKLRDVSRMIGYCLQNPVQALEEVDPVAKEEARKINLQSILNQADQVLRKLIASKMKDLQGVQTPKWSLREQATALNSKKKCFMEALKKSNELLKHLDELLSKRHEHQHRTKTFQGKSLDLVFDKRLHVEQIISSERLVVDSQPIDSKGFDFIVSELFVNFDGKGVSLSVR